jgi:hypothetical protein
MSFLIVLVGLVAVLLLKRLFGAFVYTTVAPVDGRYVFDKPLWAELIVVVINVGLVALSARQLSQGFMGDSLLENIGQTLWPVLFLLTWGVRALREAANALDFIEIGPERLRFRDGDDVKTFRRADIVDVTFAEESDGPFGKTTRMTLRVRDRTGALVEVKYGLADMNLEGYAPQIIALLAPAPAAPKTVRA